MTFYDNSIFTSRSFQFHIQPFRLTRNTEIAIHDHAFVELVWITSGVGEHQYQGQSATIATGDVFVIEPGEEHGYRVAGAELAGYNLLFQPDLLQAEFAVLANVSSFVDFFYVEPFLRQSHHFVKHLQLTTPEQMDMRRWCEQLEHEVGHHEDGYRIMIKALLIQLFIFLSRCYQQRQRPLLGTFVGDKAIIGRICAFIEMHQTMPLTLEQVSQLCGMSVSTFTSKFKAYTGKTFVQYRNDTRMYTAKALLSETNDSISAIAMKVGFRDISHFHKTFKAAYGVAPAEYRQTHLHCSHSVSPLPV